MNIDDPKLTAYALDELDEAERAVIAHEVARSPQAQREVQETQTVARLLRAEFAAETEQRQDADGTTKPLSANLGDIRDDPWFWSIARPLAIAAVIAVFAVIGLAIFGGYKLHQNEIAPASRHPTNLPLAAPSDVEAEMAETTTPMIALQRPAAAQPEFGEKLSQDGDIRTQNGKFNTADYGHFIENSFLPALDNPLSTFAIDVDTASYSILRRFINDGSLPPKDAVRIEEMINYFTYDYPQPKPNEPFSINVDIASCPWEEAHLPARIGLRGREIAQDKRGPSNLVFLLDVSGSMTPPERLPLVKQAMRLLVEKLSEKDRVAIVIYAGASGLALPSISGEHKEQILSALESLQAGGSTNGAEGIQLAYKIASDNFIKGGVNRVILATDGDFNVGVTSQGELIRLIEEKAKSGVFLSVLGVGDDNLKDSTMQKLADKGNGNYAYLDSLDEARKVLVQQMNGTLVTIAKDVKIQVEFNPARVASYRLIGYEKRMLRKEDFSNDKIDAGEIGAGHTVTALYEVVPVGAAVKIGRASCRKECRRRGWEDRE